MKTLNPDSIAAPFAAYSHGVECRARRLVLTSGQLGMHKDGSIPDGVRDQSDVCFANIDAILAEAGLSRANVLRLNAFVTHRDHMAGYMAARDYWLRDIEAKPASTLMIVSGFTRPEFLVEIEAIAARED